LCVSSWTLANKLPFSRISDGLGDNWQCRTHARRALHSAHASTASFNGDFQVLHPNEPVPEPSHDSALGRHIRAIATFFELVLLRGHSVSIIRHSGIAFDGEQESHYVSAVARIVEDVSGAFVQASGEQNDGVRGISLVAQACG
jgi:hypothetical protein